MLVAREQLDLRNERIVRLDEAVTSAAHRYFTAPAHHEDTQSPTLYVVNDLEREEALPIRVETIDDPNNTVVQFDLAGFTAESQRLLGVGKTKNIINSEAEREVTNSYREGTALGSRLVEDINIEQDKVYTSYQLQGRNEGSGVMRVADLGFMIAELTKLPEVLGLHGRVISMEGDMGRFVFETPEEALTFCVAARAFLHNQFKENRLDKISVRFGMAEVSEPIHLYINKANGEIVSVSGGVHLVGSVESSTPKGGICMTDKLVEKLWHQKGITVVKAQENDYSHVEVLNETALEEQVESLLCKLDQTESNSSGEVRPRPISYAKLYIPDGLDYRDALVHLQKLAKDSGLSFVKFNTIHGKNGRSAYVTLVCTADGTTPVTTIVDGFARFGQVCTDLGYKGVMGVSYGAVWLGQLGNTENGKQDAMSPFLNLAARIAQGVSCEDAVEIVLHDSVVRELFHEGKTLTIPTRMPPITAKGIPEGISAYRYEVETGIIDIPFMEELENEAQGEEAADSLTYFLHERLLEWNYGRLDITQIIKTVSFYSGLYERKNDPIGPGNRHFLVEDLKFLVRLVIGHVMASQIQGEDNPSLTSILSELTKHVWNLHYPQLLLGVLDTEPDESHEEFEARVWFGQKDINMAMARAFLSVGDVGLGVYPGASLVRSIVHLPFLILDGFVSDRSENDTVGEKEALMYCAALTLGRVFEFRFETIMKAFGVPRNVVDSLVEKGLLDGEKAPLGMLIPPLAYIIDSSIHPRVRSEIHRRVVLYLLHEFYKNSESHSELFTKDLYTISRVCMLHAMYIEDIQHDDYYGLDNVVGITLNHAWKHEQYADILIFGDSFFKFFERPMQRSLSLNYAFSQMMVGDLDVARELINKIIEDSESSSEQRTRAQLYMVMLRLKVNHLDTEQIEECLTQLREMDNVVLSKNDTGLRLNYIEMCEEKLHGGSGRLTKSEFALRRHQWTKSR